MPARHVLVSALCIGLAAPGWAASLVVTPSGTEHVLSFESDPLPGRIETDTATSFDDVIVSGWMAFSSIGGTDSTDWLLFDGGGTIARWPETYIVDASFDTASVYLTGNPFRLAGGALELTGEPGALTLIGPVAGSVNAQTVTLRSDGTSVSYSGYYWETTGFGPTGEIYKTVTAPVPLPATLPLILVGLAGLLQAKRSRIALNPAS